MYIAGSKTTDDWKLMRAALLLGGNVSLWKEATSEFFHARLFLRYLDPIQCLQENGTYQGEGFSIVAIQCTLIEFLESTLRGLTYRYLRGREELREYEYSSSRDLFIDFLTTHQPFDKFFDKAIAEDFYEGIRCGLLHEAQTKNGWCIWAKSPTCAIIDASARIIYRDDFQQALLTFTSWYEEQLPRDALLQEAFIRKFDVLATM